MKTYPDILKIEDIKKEHIEDLFDIKELDNNVIELEISKKTIIDFIMLLINNSNNFNIEIKIKE